MDNFNHVSFDSPMSWEIGGESILHCDIQPAIPKNDEPATVRVSHSNVYGPVDDVEFYVRIGDPQNPTSFEDLNSSNDWVLMVLSEETVHFNDEEHRRADVAERLDPHEENPWTGTFVATLKFPAGKHRIEIKVSSGGPIQSGVISDWQLEVI